MIKEKYKLRKRRDSDQTKDVAVCRCVTDGEGDVVGETLERIERDICVKRKKKMKTICITCFILCSPSHIIM